MHHGYCISRDSKHLQIQEQKKKARNTSYADLVYASWHETLKVKKEVKGYVYTW
jgi:hypothetical protein